MYSYFKHKLLSENIVFFFKALGERINLNYKIM